MEKDGPIPADLQAEAARSPGPAAAGWQRRSAAAPARRPAPSCARLRRWLLSPAPSQPARTKWLVCWDGGGEGSDPSLGGGVGAAVGFKLRLELCRARRGGVGGKWHLSILLPKMLPRSTRGDIPAKARCKGVGGQAALWDWFPPFGCGCGGRWRMAF